MERQRDKCSWVSCRSGHVRVQGGGGGWGGGEKERGVGLWRRGGDGMNDE